MQSIIGKSKMILCWIISIWKKITTLIFFQVTTGKRGGWKGKYMVIVLKLLVENTQIFKMLRLRYE